MAKSKNRRKKNKKKRNTSPRSTKPNQAVQSPKSAEAPNSVAGEDIARAKAEVRQCMQSANYQGAVDAFHRLGMLTPDDGVPFNGMATALALDGRLEQARDAQQKAIDLSPENYAYRLNLAKIMLMQDDFDAARPLLEELTTGCPVSRQAELESLKSALPTISGGFNFGTVDKGAPSQATQPATPASRPMDWSQKPAPETEPAKPVARPLPQAPVMEKTQRPLNVLFVQEAPCIRNYKTASALRARGHKVTLGYTQATLSQMYKGLSDDTYNQCIKLETDRMLWDISADYDLVHCHNEPDVLSVSALAGQAPVIHDTHDLISLRAGGDRSLQFFEGVANRGAHGRVYTTPYQRDEARNRYGVDGPSLVFYNYTSASDLPKRMLPKLSDEDGQTHIVYEGGIGQQGHRDFGELFMDLAQHGLHIHIYPARFDPAIEALFAAYDKIHYNQPLSPTEIMEEMTKFDAGIIPFNLVKGNREFLNSTIANKLFEYLAAGLPVLTSGLQSYVDYFAANKVGTTFEGADDFITKLPGLLEMAKTTNLTEYAKTYDGEVVRLEEFYYQVVDAYKADARTEDQPAVEPDPQPVEEPKPSVFGNSRSVSMEDLFSQSAGSPMM